MSTILFLLGTLIYAIGWFAGTVVGARWFASRMDSCRYHEYDRLWCRETHMGGGHWRGDGTVGYRELWSAALPALIWPVTLVPLAALVLANHKPTARANALRIAELERELGIGGRAA